MEEWGVDLAVTGSQKGLMLPAGLGILGISQKAIAACKTATLRRSYFDIAAQLSMNATGYFPYTPPTQLLHGLRAALARIMDEGFGQRRRPPSPYRRRCPARRVGHWSEPVR